MKSTAFQTWLENIFGSGNVKEVVLTTPTALPTADVKARDNTVPFQENTMVAGEKESFVCEYHFVGDQEQIDQVYTVVSDGLKKMTPSTFEGEYNGTKFGFQYVISGNEIYAFNYTGGMSEVFFYYDKDTVYGARTDGDKKEYLLKINLSENTVEKISNDHMLCNFVMSPSGTKLLCNHRGDAYWSVFDVKTHTEKKIDTALVNGYARTSDIDFLDEIGGKFKFTKPELNIILRNKGIGVPMSVDATFYGQNAEGDTLTLKLEEGKELLTLGNKSNIVLPDTLGLNKDNSNIVDFLSLPPTGDISYQGTVTVNPQGDEDNVIYSDGEIDLDAYVRIPFALSAEGLNYKDTLNDIDIDPKYADKIKEGVITITAVNGLPLNLQIPNLVLLGENGETLENLTAVKGRDIIQAANGKESVLEFNLTQAQAKKLGQTENILLEVKASTTNNQEVVVAADAKLSFDLKLVAKAVITDLDDF